MMNYLREMAEVASTISTGDLRKRIAPRSEREILDDLTLVVLKQQ